MKNFYIKIIVLVTYLGMVTVNALANILPINGISTGEISDNYANLFAPAGITFSIWGIIYLLLGAYVLYQLNFFGKVRYKKIDKINVYFILTSLANILWILAWHYDYILLSLVLMIVILYYLIKIASVLNKEKFSNKEYFFILLPFSIYFGWITVATIANVTVFLVSINWDGFGISDQIWTIIVILIGTLIGLLRMFYDKNIAYGLVFLWAYFGIWLKHTTFFSSMYQGIIITVLSCMFLFLVSIFYLIYEKYY